MLEQYDFLSEQIKKQTQLLEELALTGHYKERVVILRTVPGIGLIAAMELLLELQDVAGKIEGATAESSHLYTIEAQSARAGWALQFFVMIQYF